MSAPADLSASAETKLPKLPLPLGAKLMVVGDSISAFNDGVLPAAAADGVVFPRLSGAVEMAWALDPRFNFDSWFDPLDPWIKAVGLGGRGMDGANQGIQSDHLDWCKPAFGNGILNRIPYDLTRAPQIVWLNAGTNTINSGDDCNAKPPVTAEYVEERLSRIIDVFASRNVWVILSTLYPRGDWGVGDPRHEILRKVNLWIRKQAGRRGIVGIMDPYERLVSAKNPDQVNGSLYQEGDKGIHPNAAGGWVIGHDFLLPLIRKAIAPGSVFDQDPLKANLLSPATALLNGGDAGSKSGNVTGEIATGFSLVQSKDASIVTASLGPAGPFKQQTISIVPSVTGKSYSQILFSAPPITTKLPSRGEWIRAYVHVTDLNNPSVSNARLVTQIRYLSGAPQFIVANFEPSPTYSVPTPGRGSYWIATKPIRLRDTPTFLAPCLYLFVPSLGYAKNARIAVKVDHFIIRRSADPRLVWNVH